MIGVSILAGGGGGHLRRAEQAHHFVAYRIEAFKDDMDAYMRALRLSAPAPGEQRVLYAGIPEHETELERTRHGIPYHPEVIEWFRGTIEELRIPDRIS